MSWRVSLFQSHLSVMDGWSQMRPFPLFPSKTGSCYVALADWNLVYRPGWLKLTELHLPLLPECWDRRHSSLCLTAVPTLNAHLTTEVQPPL